MRSHVFYQQGDFSIEINHFLKILVELGWVHILFCIAKQEEAVSSSLSGDNTAIII